MLTVQNIAIAFVGGMLPALLWLWFWLHEDRHPEPKKFIALSFLGGMLSVPLVIPFEHYAQTWLPAGILIVLAWAAIEEFTKFQAMHIIDLHRKVFDEPMDAVIYMITVALGFAALENTFFLLDPLVGGSLSHTILTGNLRFLGASLLHVLTSATVGVFIALSFYKPHVVRLLYLTVGLILAISLHTLFNFLIIRSNGGQTLSVFVGVWVGIIFLFIILERIKRIKAPRTLLH